MEQKKLGIAALQPLRLQLLGLTLPSSTNAGQAQHPPQQLPGSGVMLQGRRKSPAPSSSSAPTRSGVPISVAVEVVVVMWR